MAATQLVQFSINTIDVLMIGRLGPEALAASSLGLVIFFGLYMFGIGPVMAVLPVVSQALGAKSDDFAEARRSVRAGLWVVIISFPVALIIGLCTTDIALAFGQPEIAARLAGPYVAMLMPGLPFALSVLILRNFLAAIDRTRVPLAIIILTTIINALLNWLFIYGVGPFPELHLVGAGLASTLSHIIGFSLLAGYIMREKYAKKFDLFLNFRKIDWPRVREIVRLGWPISVTTMFEGMLFNASILLTGLIGLIEVAAFQVALNFVALIFMIPMGLSMAGAVRVGLAAGARDLTRVQYAATATIFVSTLVMTVFALIVGFFPNAIAGLYLSADSPDNQIVIEFVTAFLPIAAAFMIFDGVQVAANQCLRGLKDVRMPMIMTGISYWLIGFPFAAWLGLASPLGAEGVWWGLVISLVTASILLGGRLWWIMRSPDRALPSPGAQEDIAQS